MKTRWKDSFAQPPSWFPDLGEAEVHVWAMELAAMPGSLCTLLSPDEREAAERLRFADDRHRFVAARGSLRQILGEYSGAPPAGLRFCYGERGKPSLEDQRSLDFNLTHSGDVALLAVTHIGPIGVDVEEKRPIEDLLGIARRNFSPGEYEALLDLPEAARLDGFYRCWTRKEAYVKAVGDGLALPLGEFEVSLAPEDQARLLSLGGSRSEARLWFLQGLQPATGYVGALAVKGQPAAVAGWIWQHR